MGKPKMQVSKQEAALLEEAAQEVLKIRSRMDKLPHRVEKSTFSRMGRKKQGEILSAILDHEHQILWGMIRKANGYYDALKGKLDKGATTHEFITEQAISLAGISIPGVKEALMASCMDPDRETRLWELAYEGHFYGRIKGRQFGNFWPRVFQGPSVWILDKINDIDETALSNFRRYYTRARRDRTRLNELGWAAHYLQDLTAPHHAGNMAIFFEMFTDGTNTHFPFEKFARNIVFSHPGAFAAKAREHLEGLRTVFDPKKPAGLGRAVYKRAVGNVPKVKVEDEPLWRDAVRDAIPLAIGATALILEPWRS